jgi:nucleoid-associated protein YgaU
MRGVGVQGVGVQGVGVRGVGVRGDAGAGAEDLARAPLAPSPWGAAPSPSVRRRPARSDAPPLRLTRRGRVVVILLAVALLTLTASVARVASSASPPPRPARVHVVAPGETLWQIALSVHPGGDPRVEVAKLIAVNHLPTASLVPGQAIRLP